MHTLRLLRSGLAAVTILSAASCEQISSHRLEAITADARNARREGDGPLLAGETVAAGTTIETAASGRADLLLLPNMLLRLDENAAAQIRELTVRVDGNETSGGIRARAAGVRLDRGRFTARLGQHGYNTALLTFQTGRGEIRADGNALIEITETREMTSAICVRGHFDASPLAADHVSTVWPGEALRMERGGARHVTLGASERAEAEARCSRVEAALAFETSAQLEARR